jgi:uncharacterized protein with FMN-binding domain
METPKKINPAIAALIVIVLIGAGTAAAVMLKDNSNDTAVETTTAQNTSETSIPSSSPTETTSTSEYKDGTYNAEGTYVSPGGRESIGLTVTLANGVIVNTEFDGHATDGDAVMYQQKFASGYKAEVVGKNIDDIKLSRVAGSSLTSNGFNDAIEQIRTDAGA